MRNRKQVAGFSLIELLVVVSVIAVIVSIGLLSLSILGDDRPLRVEARRLGSLLDAAQDEAIMQGREIGLEVMLDSYRFVEYDAFQSTWFELQADDIFRFRKLPEDLEFDLLLEDKLILLSADPQNIDDPDARKNDSSRKDYAPHVMIFSSGDATPFELRIVKRAQQQIVILQGDVAGEINVLTAEEQTNAMR